MWDHMRDRFCSCSSRRADQALAASEVYRRRRQNAVETSRCSNRLMNEALAALRDALKRTTH